MESLFSPKCSLTGSALEQVLCFSCAISPDEYYITIGFLFMIDAVFIWQKRVNALDFII